MAAAFLLAGLLPGVAWAASPGRPGTLNYFEGQAAIGTQPLDPKAVGSVEVAPGQSLNVEKGKAEVLLTPGVFLRIGDNSSIQMNSADLLNTEVRLIKGRAMVEVADIRRQNNLRVSEDGASVQLAKTGLYAFDADRDQLRVFEGMALVQEGSNVVKVKSGHELDLNPSRSLKAQKFDKNKNQDDLYTWSSLRSGYLAEANVDAARTYTSSAWFGTGWYWDPWYSAYTYIPGDGLFYSPFGWGFYSPFAVFDAPFFFGEGRFHHFDHDFHRGGPGSHDGSRAFSGHGFHSGSAVGTHANGGFHGGSGFHGGNGFQGGGGMHGGGGFGGGGMHGGGGGHGR
jgi:hypothetical protein